MDVIPTQLMCSHSLPICSYYPLLKENLMYTKLQFFSAYHLIQIVVHNNNNNDKKVNTIDQQKKKTIKHKCALAQWESGAGVFLQQTIKYWETDRGSRLLTTLWQGLITNPCLSAGAKQIWTQRAIKIWRTLGLLQHSNTVKVSADRFLERHQIQNVNNQFFILTVGGSFHHNAN